jgi:MoxR-like ATPase
VILAPHVQDYIVRLCWPRIPRGQFALPITNQYLRWGASPRGAQTLALAAKVRALLEGRYNVSFEDVRRVYLPALRHRVILNFEAQAEGIDTDHVLLGFCHAFPAPGLRSPTILSPPSTRIWVWSRSTTTARSSWPTFLG